MKTMTARRRWRRRRSTRSSCRREAQSLLRARRAVRASLLDEFLEESGVLAGLGVPLDADREAQRSGPRPPRACRPPPTRSRRGRLRLARAPGGGAMSPPSARRRSPQAAIPLSPPPDGRRTRLAPACDRRSRPPRAGAGRGLLHARRSAAGSRGRSRAWAGPVRAPPATAPARPRRDASVACPSPGERLLRSVPDRRPHPPRTRSRPARRESPRRPSSAGGMTRARPPARSIASTYASGTSAAGRCHTPQRASCAYDVTPMTGLIRARSPRSRVCRLRTPARALPPASSWCGGRARSRRRAPRAHPEGRPSPTRTARPAPVGRPRHASSTGRSRRSRRRRTGSTSPAPRSWGSPGSPASTRARASVRSSTTTGTSFGSSSSHECSSSSVTDPWARIGPVSSSASMRCHV